MKNASVLLVSIALLSISGCASLGKALSVRNYTVDGVVTMVEQEPEQCVDYNEQSGSNLGKQLVGGGIGGLAGNQFGSGNGRKAMTIVGALAGATLASSGQETGNYRCFQGQYISTVRYADPVNGSTSYKSLRTRHPMAEGKTVRFQVRQ